MDNFRPASVQCASSGFAAVRFKAICRLSRPHNGAYYLKVLLKVIGNAFTGVRSGTGGVEVPSPEKHR